MQNEDGVICGTFRRWNSAKYTFLNFHILYSTFRKVHFPAYGTYNRMHYDTEAICTASDQRRKLMKIY